MVCKVSVAFTVALLGLASALAGTQPAQALQTSLQTSKPIPWQGQIVLTTVPSPCQVDGWAQYDYLTAVYRPKFTNSTYTQNTNPEGLSVYVGRAAYAIFANNASGLLRGSSVPVQTTRIGSRVSVTSWSTSVVSLTVSPTTIGPTSTYINISGTISNFDNLAGCNVSFQGSLTERPN
jgi:hypothetical protein